MLVSLYQCWRDDEELTDGQRDGPHRGWIRISRSTVAGETTLHADLHFSTGGGSPRVVPGLSHVEFRWMDERGFVIFGKQHKTGQPLEEPQRQKWFCEPVLA